MTHDFSNSSLPGNNSNASDSNVGLIEEQTFPVFDLWMDVQLEKLVAQWIHTAAPNAQRGGLLRNRGGGESR